MVQIMNNSWEEIIIVGLGNHSKTKIIPAIEKTCLSKISILSNKNLLDSKHKIYNSLEKALEKKVNIFLKKRVRKNDEAEYKFQKKI